MKKSYLAIGSVGLLIVILFSVDYWLRAHKKFVGGEVVDTPATTDSSKQPSAKVESFETLFERASSISGAHERASQFLSLDGQLLSRNEADGVAKRRKVLSELIRTCPNEPASADAASRLIVIAEHASDEAGLADGAQKLLDAAGRMGIYEKGVMPGLLANVVRFLEKHKELAAKLQAALDSPQDYGPEDVREVVRFRVGMKLSAEEFPAADNVDQVVKYRRRNMTKKPLSEELTWRGGDQGPWKIEPLNAHVSLAPGEEKTVEFRVKFDRALGEPVPYPSLKSVITRDGEPDSTSLDRAPMDTRGYREGRIIHCTRVDKAPTIDGSLDDEAWTKCKPASLLYCYNGFTPAPSDTEVRLCYDDKGLYVSMRVYEADMEHIQAVMTDRDSDVCKDDSVEMMFNPKPEQTDYFQVIVNSKNTQYDGICWDRSVNFNWKSAIGKDDKGWLVEMFLPWAEFAIDDVPKPGTKMVANFYRNRYRDKYVLTQWSPSFVINNHLQEYYGTMLFE